MQLIFRTIGIVLAILFVTAGVSLGQKALEENPFYLRSDNRLQVALNLPGEHANLAQIVASLRWATGLELNIDGNLQNHQPDFGGIQPSKTGFRAWQLMEMIAKKDLENGYWEKTDQGYILKGNSLAIGAQIDPNPGGLFGVGLLLVVGFSLLFILLCLLVMRLASRRKNGSVPPKSKQAVAVL